MEWYCRFNQLSNKTSQFPWLTWWFLPMMVLACLLAGFSVILIALLTISVQALRSALSNPLDSLRNE